MIPISPEQLLAAAQAGDRAALERLLTEHRNGVYRYGLRVCRTTKDVEDAVQETLWAATRAIKTFRGTATSIAAWLFTIVRHQCYQLLERRRRDEQLAVVCEAAPTFSGSVGRDDGRGAAPAPGRYAGHLKLWVPRSDPPA